jgi:predicted dehydrogenase
LRGTRQGEEQFQEIALPAELIGEVDTNTPFMSHLFELFAQQPIGPRLFIDSILAGRKVTPSFHDGLHAQLVIDAALQSHRCGRRVALGEGQL